MAMKTLLSKKEWKGLDLHQRRELFGEDRISGNYITFLENYFDPIKWEGDTYSMYVKWHLYENSPLGRALK